MPILQILVMLLIFAACWITYVYSQPIEYPEEPELTKEEIDGDYLWSYEYTGTRYKSITLTSIKTGQSITGTVNEGEIEFKDKAGKDIPELKQGAPAYNFGGVQMAMRKYLNREMPKEEKKLKPIKSIREHVTPDYRPLSKEDELEIIGGRRRPLPYQNSISFNNAYNNNQ